MERSLPFEEEHEILRAQVRRFLERECVPYHQDWERAGQVPREIWETAGKAGLLCATTAEEYGGAGAGFLHSLIIIEEMVHALVSGPGFGLHSDIVAPYIEKYGTEDQKRRWLPRMATGELISAIAMTEPGTGSDLQGVKTTALREGNEYVVNGSKTFITNGQLANLICVVAKTDPGEEASGVSLIFVETDGAEGFSRGRNLEKLGMHAQDTSELFFQDVRVPPENLLGGDEGQGFFQLMEQLPQERLIIAIGAVAAAVKALEITREYVNQRHAFGRPIAKFQNTRFTMADMATEVAAGRAFTDHCTVLHLEGKLDTAGAAMCKLWTTEMEFRVMDQCLQLHGGYGYMTEYPIARMWASSRVQRIYGGTSEIMKELISRTV